MAAWQRQYPQLQNSYLLTLPGRVSRRKGIYDFLDIVAVLAARGVSVHGLVAGEFPRGATGPCRKLSSRANSPALKGLITFAGYRSDVREIMAVSSVVLSLSRQPEAFGRTVNEALGLGVPVAGYAHGGVGEQLARHFPAGRVPPLDTGAMVDLLEAWNTAPPSMQGVSPYTLADMLDSTLELYRKAKELSLIHI